jgi:ATP synthase protein I
VDAASPVAPSAVAGGDHEREIARDLGRRALVFSPVALVLAGVLAGWQGALGAALGIVVVAGNFLLLAWVMSAAVKAGNQAVAFAAMLGYLAMLVIVTVLAIIVREIPAIDLASFVLTVAIAHVALLFLELPRLGLTPGAPGLKPRPLSRTEPKK